MFVWKGLAEVRIRGKVRIGMDIWAGIEDWAKVEVGDFGMDLGAVWRKGRDVKGSFEVVVETKVHIRRVEAESLGEAEEKVKKFLGDKEKWNLGIVGSEGLSINELRVVGVEVLGVELQKQVGGV